MKMKHRKKPEAGSQRPEANQVGGTFYCFEKFSLQSTPTVNCQLPITNSNLKRKICFLFAIILALASCNSGYTPKPRGYFKIDFPEKEYRIFDQPGYPYTFEYPVYGTIIKDSLFFDQHPENPYWINIDFPRFNGRIHLSYKEIGKNKFDSLVNDAFTMSYKQHTYRASAIQREPFTSPNGSGGVYFTLKGNAATGNQFFVSDSTRHFLRGALYFAATPNSDSLQPVNDFLKKDLWHLINTLKWR
jgi:gliding motility-associated lipoprotein GldD